MIATPAMSEIVKPSDKFPDFACQKKLTPAEWAEQERKLAQLYYDSTAYRALTHTATEKAT